MGDHSSPEQLKKDIRVYLTIFGALLAGTVLTVWLYYIHIPTVKLTIAIALLVASVKSFLVAGYFMHLMSEKKVIYSLLCATVFFFVALMALTLWAMHDFPAFTSVFGNQQ